MGMECAIACPDGYKPDAEIMKWAEENGKFMCSDNILECAKDADILYTDVWASMGQEEEKAEREKIFKDFQINDSVMEAAKADAMVLHCLPAHREEEITKFIKGTLLILFLQFASQFSNLLINLVPNILTLIPVEAHVPCLVLNAVCLD